MAQSHPIAPFFQLGRQITFLVLVGNSTEEVTGEVMDTDTGWIAVKNMADGAIYWYNLDHIIRIQVRGHIGPA